MATLTKNALLLLTWLLLPACGLTLPKEEATPSVPTRDLGQGLIDGRFRSLEGEQVYLGADSAKAQVLMFVSETCAICREEIETLVRDRAARGIPANVAFYSIVVGSIAEDADDWRRGLGVDWIVGLDPGDALFRTYCPGLQTPCTVLRNPAEGTLTALTGRHSIADWERLTGPWTY